ncbi:MAG: tryptophan--tRNA ligase [bacterium]|nr:tryptophan--tRNA ligase [bacterium]
MTIISGIQPSGRLHVGNALGAVRHWLGLQGDGTNRCFFFIADWHSLTEEYDPAQKVAQVRELGAELLALGIDPERAALFRQSDVPEHLELAWYFNCVTPMAELQRMTQFKDKVGHGESPNVGLFSYPVLMAADILAYSQDRDTQGVGVPVGDDQKQHIEFTNHIGRWFNNRYGETFPEVQGLHTETARIMSLKDPSRKMSKSAGAAHCLFLDDEPEVVMKKLKSAVTETTPSSSPSGRGGGQSAGVQTLFAILEAYAPHEVVARFREQLADGSIRYSELKSAVAEHFIEAHADFRRRKAELMAHPEQIDAALTHGAERARAVAQTTLRTIRQRVGIA